MYTSLSKLLERPGVRYVYDLVGDEIDVLLSNDEFGGISGTGLFSVVC